MGKVGVYAGPGFPVVHERPSYIPTPVTPPPCPYPASRLPRRRYLSACVVSASVAHTPCVRCVAFVAELSCVQAVCGV